MQTRIQPGNKFWQQPGLEKIIEGIRGASPVLQKADDYPLFRLLVIAKKKEGPLRILRELGAIGDRSMIQLHIDGIYENSPWLFEYFQNFGRTATPDADAGGIPTYEYYRDAMESTEQRAKFGVRSEDKPQRYGNRSWYFRDLP